MKAILGALLCYVLMASQCFALKGGPPYPGGGAGAASTGTFSGVLVPQQGFANSIGLFSVVFPTKGLGTGTLVIFQTGQTYVGTVQGLVDPKGSAVSALLYATFPYVTFITNIDKDGNRTQVAVNVIAVASGQLSGKVTTGARLTGTADVQFSLAVNSVDSEVIYNVFGFLQS